MAEIRDGVGLPADEKRLRDPEQAFTFQCKCGCELFRVDTEVYADYRWAAIMSCAACGQVCVPTEPITNGPH